VKLFVRKHHSVALTVTGEEFVHMAEEILAKIDEISGKMTRYNSVDRGILKVGVLWVWGYLGINKCLSDFQRQHPNLEINLVPQGSIDLLEMLKNRKLDCCIIIATEGMLGSPSLYSYKIIEDNYRAIMHTGHPLSGKGSLDFSYIAEHAIILPSSDSTSHDVIVKAFAKQNIKPKIACESMQSAITIQLVSDGIGIGFVSESIANTFSNNCFVSVPLVRK